MRVPPNHAKAGVGYSNSPTKTLKDFVVSPGEFQRRSDVGSRAIRNLRMGSRSGRVTPLGEVHRQPKSSWYPRPYWERCASTDFPGFEGSRTQRKPR
jgi:hypothetical protein